MMRYLRLLGLFIRVSVQDDVAYRVDFVAHVLVAVISMGAELVGLWTIFSNTTAVGGWNAYQMLTILGVFRFMYGFIGLAISPNMRRIMEEIRDGRLDFVVLTPINTQFYATTRKLVIWRVTDLVLGIILVAAGCSRLTNTLSPQSLCAFVVLLAAGAVTIYSCWLILATCAFWFTRLNNIEMVFWNVFEAGRYPVDIYPTPVRIFVTYLVPLAFIITFPAAALVGKAHLTHVFLAVAVAAGTLVASSAFWRYGLRHYSGASA